MNEDKLFVGFCWYSLCCLDYKIIHLPVIRRRETPAENYYQWTFLVLLLQEKLKRKHWNTKATKNTIKASHESKVTKHSSLQLFFSHHDQDCSSHPLRQKIWCIPPKKMQHNQRISPWKTRATVHICQSWLTVSSFHQLRVAVLGRLSLGCGASAWGSLHLDGVGRGGVGGIVGVAGDIWRGRVVLWDVRK